ncbi:CotH kinase family protein [Maribacter halichondriae]|uniref:CotH kinase family protein n=1 Tax=Maribacter halichondriae TaxID=2980554 RepID=UPI002358F05A|nr:CotH kinase family protein [Maribacter sp. Hal144]
MNFSKLLCFLIVFSFVISCKNDDSAIGPLEPPNKEGTLTLTTSVVVDNDNKLILYNGGDVALKNNVVINETTYALNTTDTDFMVGKAYTLTIGNDSYTFYRTQLPVIDINTNGGEIIDPDKIAADFVLYETDKDPFESIIGIEFRGGLSVTFPKKSYGIELWEDTAGTTFNESLLGMRSDDDWILDAMYNEPAKLRDFVSHDLWLDMARYHYSAQESDITFGIKRQYVEIFVNGKYGGVYWLGEKIDRKQLGLERYDSGIRGELYKGDDWGEGTLYNSLEPFDNNSLFWSGFEADYPDDIGEVDWTNLHDFVDFVINADDATFDAEMNTRMDVPNLIDYFIFVNIIFAQDNLGKNIFTGRYDQDAPYFHVAWDMDSSWGNDFIGDRADPATYPLFNGMYRRLQGNNDFVTALKARWMELRGNLLSDASLEARFIAAHNYLSSNGVYEREAIDANLIQKPYDPAEIDFITAWLKERNTYLDGWIAISETP